MRKLRSSFLVLPVALVAACSDGSPVDSASQISAGKAPLRAAAPGKAIEGSYIVVLKEGADPRSVAAVAKAEPVYVYTAVLNGFSATLNQGQLNALQHNPNVEYVEQDQAGGVTTTQSGATWGIDRIDQRSRPLSGTYTYTATGTGVRAYVIDTGLQANHPQFGTRASNVYDYAGGTGADCHGHGTHVGGTIGSSTYGVAKNVMLRGVRAATCAGGSSSSIIIAAMDWVRLNHVKPAVANISMGFPFSSSINTAATNLHNAGVFTVVAAGNENQSACNVSPASASAVLTMAASTSTDARASYSNHGSCVDLYAPGSSITSTWIGSSTRAISGTSMASPHGAGVAALYKSALGDAAGSVIDTWIKTNSTASVITGNITGTPNRLLFKAAL